ncbi:Transcription factor SRM1 [Bienertia sinuspersici]
MNSDEFGYNWDKIAAEIPGNKTIEEVKQHYQALLDDIQLIESGKVPLPCYTKHKSKTKTKTKTNIKSNSDFITNINTNPCIDSTIIPKKRTRETEWESRKGKMWTEEEHKLFLLGMETYGKGDWKGIAKDFVKTRNATQVASHAQKHFNRQTKKQKKEVKRWSIFDIINPSDNLGGYSYLGCYEIGSSSNSNNNNNDNVINNNYTGVENETMMSIINEANKEEVQAQQQISMVESVEYMSPPDFWCPKEDDLDIDFDIAIECLSQLPPL